MILNDSFKLYFYFILILLISYFTYFSGYYNPAKEFWDENYHIASAQKYIDGVAYMETHPPLGKLLIALGEVIKHPNDAIDKSPFLKTDYIKNFPNGLSYEGYRLFPTLFATLNAVIFFFIIYLIIKNLSISFLLCGIYLFENALIVHSRAAMLESIQLFFVFLAILYFIYITQKSKIFYYEYSFLGVIIGLGVAVKLNGLIMIMLLFFLFIFEYMNKESSIKLFFREQCIKQILALLSLVVIFVGVFYVHFALGNKMPTHTKYNISKEYKAIIKKEEMYTILNIPTMLYDNLEYIKNYSKNVPKYNPCKEGENGSLCLTWPFGNKSINYRWEKEGGKVKYLYLQGNPLIWMSAFFAVLLSCGLIISRYIYSMPIKNKTTFFYVGTFLSMYLSYMFVMYHIERVMYLYHYFVPLIFSLILMVLIFYYVFEEYIKNNNKILLLVLVGFFLLTFGTYYFFSPLTYYEALSPLEFEQRVWFDFWKLKAIP